MQSRISARFMLRALALIALMLGTHGVCHGGITPTAAVFTYQGELRLSGAPVDGTVAMRFRLFNTAAGGIQFGPTLTDCAVEVVDGLFTVELDFGAGAFEGSGRWLDIGVQSPVGDCATFVLLNPRQAITPAPYSIRSLAPWEPGAPFFTNDIFFNTGNVGIGTDEPASTLEVSKPNATVRVTSTAADGTSQLDLKGDSPSGFGANVLGTIRFLDELNTVRAQISSADGFLANPFSFAVEGTTQMVLTDTGNLGVGTTLPIAKLQLVGGTDSEPGTGGFLVIGDLNDVNVSFDNNEIMARNNGAVAELFLNNDGGDVTIGGPVGIGTAPLGVNMLTVDGSIEVLSSTIHVEGTSVSDGVFVEGILGVDTISGGLTYFSREVANGTLIGFRNADNPVVGSISVSGSTVSYNAFTGSHHAWTDTPIDHGALVKLSGENRRAHPGPNCEVTYGIAPSATANDPACLGSYLSAPDPADPGASHHLVAAVGNGEMWVVDDGRGDLRPGEYLISSDVTGCAMQDDPARFAVGHVIARAAEAVDWSVIEPTGAGPRRALVSVFFESFDRQGDAVELSRLAGVVAQQRTEIAALRTRLESLEDVAERLSRLEAVNSAPVVIHAANQGGRP